MFWNQSSISQLFIDLPMANDRASVMFSWLCKFAVYFMLPCLKNCRCEILLDCSIFTYFSVTNCKYSPIYSFRRRYSQCQNTRQWRDCYPSWSPWLWGRHIHRHIQTTEEGHTCRISVHPREADLRQSVWGDCHSWYWCWQNWTNATEVWVQWCFGTKQRNRW